MHRNGRARLTAATAATAHQSFPSRCSARKLAVIGPFREESMDASEGLKPLAVAVRSIGRGLGAVFFVLSLVVAFASGHSPRMLVVSLVGLGLAVLIIGNTAVLAWMIEDFAKPRE